MAGEKLVFTLERPLLDVDDGYTEQVEAIAGEAEATVLTEAFRHGGVVDRRGRRLRVTAISCEVGVMRFGEDGIARFEGRVETPPTPVVAKPSPERERAEGPFTTGQQYIAEGEFLNDLMAQNATLRAQLEALVFMVEAGFSSGRCPLCVPQFDMASGELYAHEDECPFKGWKQQGIDLPKLVADLAEIRADTDRAVAESEARINPHKT